MECVQYHYEATVTMPDEHGQLPWKVREVLDGGSGVSYISEKMTAGLGAHFEGMRVAYPMQRTAKARVSDGRELAIEQQTH